MLQVHGRLTLRDGEQKPTFEAGVNRAKVSHCIYHLARGSPETQSANAHREGYELVYQVHDSLREGTQQGMVRDTSGLARRDSGINDMQDVIRGIDEESLLYATHIPAQK